MDINITKRHILIFFMLIFGLILVIPNYQKIKKLSEADDIRNRTGVYEYGDYVKVNFDQLLYMEYDGIDGKTQKRYAVCSTLEGDVFYVNALPETFILVEIINEDRLKDIESNPQKQFQITGVIERCAYDISDFSGEWDSKVKLEQSMLIREIEFKERDSASIFNGGMIILVSVILFLYWGGLGAIVKRREI